MSSGERSGIANFFTVLQSGATLCINGNGIFDGNTLFKTKIEKTAWKVSTYKSVSSALSRLSVRNDHGLLDVPINREMVSQRLIAGVVGQASHEQFGPGRVFVLDARSVEGAGGPQDAQAPHETVGLAGGGNSGARHQHDLVRLFCGLGVCRAFVSDAGRVIFRWSSRPASQGIHDVVYVLFGEGAPAISHRCAGWAVLHIKFPESLLSEHKNLRARVRCTCDQTTVRYQLTTAD